MCTLFIYRNKLSDWPLLIATNRDEQLGRKFYSPSYHWKDFPNIFAGKDLLKGGSWLGINKNGLCVAILNRNSLVTKNPDLVSRGNLVIEALKYSTAKEASFVIFKKIENFYNNFNLFIGDNTSAYWIKYHNKKKLIKPIPYGHSMLDKHDLNDSYSNKQKIYSKIFKSLEIPKPEKNNFKDWKNMLKMKIRYRNIKNTEVYINDLKKNYGTVSSSIIGMPKIYDKDQKAFWLYSDRLDKSRRFLFLSPFRR